MNLSFDYSCNDMILSRFQFWTSSYKDGGFYTSCLPVVKKSPDFFLGKLWQQNRCLSNAQVKKSLVVERVITSNNIVILLFCVSRQFKFLVSINTEILLTAFYTFSIVLFGRMWSLITTYFSRDDKVLHSDNLVM